VLGLGLLGLGVGGLAVGAGVGGAAAAKKSDLEKFCGTELRCPPAAHGDADDYNRMRTLSSIGWIAGAGVATLGIVLVVIPNSKAAGRETALRIAPSGAVLARSF